MTRTRALVGAITAVGLAGAAQGDLVLETVDFSFAHNFNLQDLHSNFPEGLVTLGGVPFDIPKNVPNNIWLADPTFASTEPVVLDIPVDVFGVDAVHNLINTIWGTDDPSLLSIEFFGDGDGDGGDGGKGGPNYFRMDLVGNDDIREYLQSTNTNEINGKSTVQVFASNNGVKRLDMVTIDLPDSFRSQTLLSMRITDSGSTGVQRSFVSGITLGVDPIPAPGSVALLGLGGLVATRRRR